MPLQNIPDVLRTNRLPATGQLIGWSFSACVLDIALGRMTTGRVKCIYALTLATDHAAWQRVIDRAAESAWAQHGADVVADARIIAATLIRRNKIIQPRRWQEHNLHAINEGHWTRDDGLEDALDGDAEDWDDAAPDFDMWVEDDEDFYTPDDWREFVDMLGQNEHARQNEFDGEIFRRRRAGERLPEEELTGVSAMMSNVISDINNLTPPPYDGTTASEENGDEGEDEEDEGDEDPAADAWHEAAADSFDPDAWADEEDDWAEREPLW